MGLLTGHEGPFSHAVYENVVGVIWVRRRILCIPSTVTLIPWITASTYLYDALFWVGDFAAEFILGIPVLYGIDRYLHLVTILWNT